MTGITQSSLTNTLLLDADADPMIGTTSTDAPVTDTEQRRKRQNAVNYARASVGLEGFKLSEACEQQATRFIAGEINLPDFLSLAR